MEIDGLERATRFMRAANEQSARQRRDAFDMLVAHLKSVADRCADFAAMIERGRGEVVATLLQSTAERCLLEIEVATQLWDGTLQHPFQSSPRHMAHDPDKANADGNTGS